MLCNSVLDNTKIYIINILILIIYLFIAICSSLYNKYIFIKLMYLRNKFNFTAIQIIIEKYYMLYNLVLDNINIYIIIILLNN